MRSHLFKAALGESRNPIYLKVQVTANTVQIVELSMPSGNRNFEGRVHPLTRANYLASPPLCVAFALAGMPTLSRDGRKQGPKAANQPELVLRVLRSLVPVMFPRPGGHRF